MIAVCEPQCTGASHEKVNSGFLTALSLAFPDDELRVYCDPTHAAALRSVLERDGVTISKLAFRPLAVHDTFQIRGVLAYHRTFKAIFREILSEGTQQILFLSSNPVLQHLIKRLKAQAELAAMKLVYVLHADFEDIANDTFAEPAAPAVAEPTMAEKLRMVSLAELPSKAVGFVRNHVRARYAGFWKDHFRAREQLLWRHSDDFRYIALSPHVVVNAAKYLDVAALDIRAIEMPINFAKPGPSPTNAHLKFATFGYGDVVALREVARRLEEVGTARPYEIRVIGMDNRGLEGFEHVWCPSPGKVLPRAEMEQHAADIDAFLILYDRRRYRLSCSGAIFEAFSYVKPVLHIGNACIDQFDPPAAPIGFRYENLGQLADGMREMINDPEKYAPAFAARRRHIVALRERLAMVELAPKLREILTFV